METNEGAAGLLFHDKAKSDTGLPKSSGPSRGACALNWRLGYPLSL